MNTPGVYTVEKHAFPTSVVEVATAVPVFIGHTEFAEYKGTSLKGKQWRIASLPEYHSCFGFGPKDRSVAGTGQKWLCKPLYFKAPQPI